MSFDREKFRAAPLSEVNATIAEAKQHDTYFGGSSEYAPYWKNREGVTIKRVMPAHETGESPYVPMMTIMLKCEVDKKDKEGKILGKEIANKKIFLATLHGKFPYDIAEEYIKRVYEQAESIQDKDERSRFLSPITGYRMGGKNGTWVPGIRPQLEYAYYALIEGKIYRDSLRPKQMEALNAESAELCAQNDTAAVDMFSDPDTGFPVQWSRSKDDKGKTVEVIKSLPLKMGQSWDDYFQKNAVSDKALEELMKYPSLKELYVDSYKKRDFDMALDGLKRFDDNNSYNIFAQEDYLDMIEGLQVMVEEKYANNGSEEPKQEDKVKQPKTTKKATPPAVKKSVSSKKKNISDAEKLSIVNDEFIRQYGEGYEELELEGEDLEENYQLAIKGEDLGYDIPHVASWLAGDPVEEGAVGDELNDDQEDDKPEVVEPKRKVITPPSDANSESGQSAIDRIRAMRARSGK